MALRNGHGAGKGTPRIEVLPIDEIEAPNATDTARNLAKRRGRGRPFEKGNRAAAGRRPALAGLDVEQHASDPLYRRLLRQAQRYRRRRASELEASYGYLSAGAASLLASAALATAGSRFAYAKAAESGDPTFMKLGSTLANDAR